MAKWRIVMLQLVKQICHRHKGFPLHLNKHDFQLPIPTLAFVDVSITKNEPSLHNRGIIFMNASFRV